MFNFISETNADIIEIVILKRKVKLEEEIEILKTYGHICKEVTRVDSENETNSNTLNNTYNDTYIVTNIDTIRVTEYVTKTITNMIHGMIHIKPINTGNKTLEITTSFTF